METKTGLMIAGAFVIGVGAGAAVGYLMTKKSCEQHTQDAIDEMKAAHKKEIEDIRKETKDESKEESEETEKDFVRKDKPPISEMASSFSSSIDNPGMRTKYDFVKLKESIKKETTEPEKKPEQSVIDYNAYIQLINEGYLEKQFNYDVEAEAWRDWDSNLEYDITDLPFDADQVVWDDNDQCYIAERSNQSVYILEKV